MRLLERPNAWAKISGGDRLSSGASFRDAIPFAAALVGLTPDRLVWGHRLAPFEHPHGYAE
jgi:predicted TIM-barrel fold metal-dependent hydrolase